VAKPRLPPLSHLSSSKSSLTESSLSSLVYYLYLFLHRQTELSSNTIVKFLRAAILIVCAVAAAPAPLSEGSSALVPVIVDYPEEGSLFPPEFTAPTFLFRDAAETARAWRIDVAFSDGAPEIHAKSPGDPMRVGDLDPRCVSDTNQPPRLTAQQAADRTWVPDRRALRDYAGLPV
jgi:hypothetical protein